MPIRCLHGAQGTRYAAGTVDEADPIDIHRSVVIVGDAVQHERALTPVNALQHSLLDRRVDGAVMFAQAIRYLPIGYCLRSASKVGGFS